MTLVLRQLLDSDETAFKQAVLEFKKSDPQWTFAINFDPDGEFSEFVALLRRHSQGIDLPPSFVPARYFVAVSGETIVGRVSLRYRLHDALLNVGGHIGYHRIERRCAGRQAPRVQHRQADTAPLDRLALSSSVRSTKEPVRGVVVSWGGAPLPDPTSHHSPH